MPKVNQNFFLNGAAHGDVAARLLNSNFDVRVLRPYIGKDGRTYITMNVNGIPTAIPTNNTAALLRKDEWIEIDTAVLKAAKPRLRLVADLNAAGLTHTIGNGMGTTVFQTETMSDIGDADVSMDGLRESQNDRPVFDLANLPLPIIHKDFSFSARQIAASRNGNTPLDLSMAELAGRKVAEEVEKMAIGVSTNYDLYKFGGGTIYGLSDYSNVNSVTITSPDTSGWTAETHLKEILEMREAAAADYYYGPYMLYYGTGWDEYLDEDFKAASDKSLRNRIKEVDRISDVRTLDYLASYSIILVQFTSDVIRMINAMPITTLQWETNGGMLVHFKVMTIQIPQPRSDYNTRCGIVLGTV